MPEKLVELGFAQASVPFGTHGCQLYVDASERDDALLRFLAQGLRNGEATACFSDHVGAEAVEAWLAGVGVSFSSEVSSGRLTLSAAAPVYFRDGRFDPRRMLASLEALYDAALGAGRPGVRVIGEMSGEIAQVPGGSRLMEYEAAVNRMLRTRPLTAVCQYDARAFDGETIMDVLCVHERMVVGGAVIHNPFFVAPGELARP